MLVSKSGQHEQSLERTAHRCFLPRLGSFGQSVSEEKIFKNRPIRNNNRMWWPCLLTERDEMSNLYRGPYRDTSYQLSVHLAEGFQRRKLKCEKLTDDGRQVMATAHIAFRKVSLNMWTLKKKKKSVKSQRVRFFRKQLTFSPIKLFARQTRVIGLIGLNLEAHIIHISSGISVNVIRF